MRRMATLTIAGLSALALAAYASPSTTNPLTQHFTGKVGKAVLGIEVKLSGGKIVKITHFEWEGNVCGDSFTAGSSRPITVKNDKFSSKQPVGGLNPGVHITLTVQGAFKLHETKATGWMTLAGGCSTHGKRYWSARAR